MTQSCKNCSRSLEMEFVYCPACGQKTATHRLRLNQILYDAWSQLTDIDRGLFKLLRDLVVRPGFVAREYIEGKRKKHFGPLNFYLIVGTCLILMMNVTAWLGEKSNPSAATSASSGAYDLPSKDSPGYQKESTPTPLRRLEDREQSPPSDHHEKIKRRQQSVDAFWSQYSDLVSIAAAPLLSLFFWLFYRRFGFNYAELLVASLYMIGFTNLVYALAFSPVATLLSSTHRPTQWMIGAFKVFEIAYFTYFYQQFTEGHVGRSLLRAGAASLLVSIFWSALTISLVAAYMITGFGFG